MSDMRNVDQRVEIRRKSTFGEKQSIAFESFFAGLGGDIKSHWAVRNRAGRNPTVAFYAEGDLLRLKGGTPDLEPYLLGKSWENCECRGT
jgi:hypothetical protein